jgi:hypothetical protein
MSTLEYLDRPAPGWFALRVMRTKVRKWDWVALMVDVDPDELKKYRLIPPAVRQCLFRIPGKHRNRDAACEAFNEAMATRH